MAYLGIPGDHCGEPFVGREVLPRFLVRAAGGAQPLDVRRGETDALEPLRQLEADQQRPFGHDQRLHSIGDDLEARRIPISSRHPCSLGSASPIAMSQIKRAISSIPSASAVSS